MIYRPSRLSMRIARRLKDEHGVELPLILENYCLRVDREAIAYNTNEGMDYPQWLLYEWDWSPHPSHGLANILWKGRLVAAEIGGPCSAAIQIRAAKWELEISGPASQPRIRIHSGR